MEFSRQEYWIGLLFPFPGDLPTPGIELESPALQADSLPSEPPGKPLNFLFYEKRKPLYIFKSLLSHISSYLQMNAAHKDTDCLPIFKYLLL